MQLNEISKFRAKRSSRETLLKRSAPEAEWNGIWNDNTDLFSDMIEETLNRDHSIRFRAPGDSMYPTICDGDVVIVMPIDAGSITIGDIILYRHRSGVTAHRVMRILKRSKRNSRSALQGPQDRSSSETLEFILRGDAAINDDAPVSSEQILGKVVSIERNGRRIDPYCLRIKLHCKIRRFASRIKRLLRRPNSRSA
jgi:signal peptidase I